MKSERNHGDRGGEDESVPPDDHRCKRSDGKQWRCKGYRVEGSSMCEKHLHRTGKRSEASSSSVKPRRKYIARSDTSDSGEQQDDKPVKESCITEKKIRRTGGDCREGEAITSLRMMKCSRMNAENEQEKKKPYGKNSGYEDSLGDSGKLGGQCDKKKYMFNEGFQVRKKRAHSNESKEKATEKRVRTESSSKKMISQEEEEHGDGSYKNKPESEKVSRVIKKGAGCNFTKSRLKGKSKEIAINEENKDGKYDSKRKHSAKSREPIAEAVKNESLLGRNDRKLREKKRVEVAVEKHDGADQNDCTITKGKKNGETTITSDEGKKKKINKTRKYFSTDDPYDDCQMCHQCQKSDRKVVRCKTRCLKRYCSPCIERWNITWSKKT